LDKNICTFDTKRKVNANKSFLNSKIFNINKVGALQCHCYIFVRENAGNPFLNTVPTIFNHFCAFNYFRDGLVKSLISNTYLHNIRLRMKCNNLMQREMFITIAKQSEKNASI
jgi:hypothetical protein